MKEDDTLQSAKHGLVRVIKYHSYKKIDVIFEESGFQTSIDIRTWKKGVLYDYSVNDVKVGDIYPSNSSGLFKVISKENSKNVTVEFIDTLFRKKTTHKEILKGSIKDPTITPKKGDVFPSNNYGSVEIIDYVSCLEVHYRFVMTGYVGVAPIAQIKRGSLRDPYYPITYGVGYLGVNDCYKSEPEALMVWRGMISRCYNEKDMSYINYGLRGVRVCKEWHNFQNFLRWYKSHYVEGYELDKDLTVFGNKEYSDHTCSFVPSLINTILLNRRGGRGPYPVGVTLHKPTGKYLASCNRYGESVNLGSHSTPERAFRAYKEFKERYVKEVACKFYSEGQINFNIYDTLMKWKAEPFPD